MINNYYPPGENRRVNNHLSTFCIKVLTFGVGLFVSFAALAQERTVSGKITSKDSQALPGVNILVKGTNKGTVTDADGFYKIIVNDRDVLVFSQIGQKTVEQTADNRSNIDLTLEEDVTTLGEVVVTALGISQDKRTLGYSIQEVKGTELAQTQRPNFLVSLQGRVAGLSMTSTSGLPGSSVSINLRGVNSIGGSNQPLIVIDGLITNNQTFSQHTMVSDLDNRSNDYTNRAADLNPNDIENVTVLKGPEAAALYGQDGASGAIIITTKKGSKGSGKIEYDNSFGFQKVYRFPVVQTTYGLGFNGVTPTLGTGLSTTFFGAKVSDAAEQYDNKKSFFETGYSQIHNLSLDGGSEKTTYRLSTNYVDQKGTVPSSHYRKLSIRLNSSSQIAKNLEATTSFNYILSDNIKPIRGQYGFLNNVLAYPTYDFMKNYLNADGSRRKMTAYENEPDNPLFSINKNQSRDKTNRLLANMTLSYNPFPWLSVTGRFGGDIYSTLGSYFLHPESFNGSAANVGGRIAKGSIDNYSENSRLLNGMFLTTVKKDFGKFKTSLMVGAAWDDNRYEVNSMKGEKLIIPDFNSLNNSDPATQRNKNTVTQKRVSGLLGNFTANYSDLVYLTLSGRNDWSSSMPLANRSYFYPSVALSFIFTELNALKDLPVLSYGKLRASYAEVGKDASPYLVNPSLDSRFSTGGGYAYGFFGGNTLLKPERSKGNELGLELKFFQRRIGLDVNVYKNDRIDQIVSQRLSYATGFVFGLINGGNYSNRGLEVQLSGIPVKMGDFEWNVLVNFSKTKTKVLSLPADVVEYYNSDTWLYGNARGSAFAPADVIQAYYPTANLAYNLRGAGSATAIGGNSYLRNNNGDILINPSTGLPVLNTNFLPIGDRNPKFLIGITNSFSYKNVSLSFLLDLRRGGDVFNGNEMFLYRNGLSTRSLDREQPRIITGVLRDGNENSATPTVNTIQVNPYTMGVTATDGGTSNSYYNGIPESEFVERDINWMRLRDVSVRYQIPAKMLQSQKIIKTASLFVTGTDLFLFTNYTGADPGVNGTTPATGGAGAFGIDFGSLALPRAVTFGVRVGL
jgi:TonB-linked SusC/RagA family outer membrane protein